MTGASEFAASLLETGAAGYASAAAGDLLERHPDVAARWGDGAFRRWKEHFVIRLRELSAALLLAEADLFVADVAWSRSSFASREVPLEDLLASLHCLGDVLAQELPDGSRDEPLRYLRRAIDALGEPAAEPAPEVATGPEEAEQERLALSYLEAALSGDRRRAIGTILAAVENGLSVSDAYQRVLVTAQGRVGEMWHRWEVSIAQEHFVTATTQAAMSLLAQRFPVKEPNGKTALVAVVPGNGHDLAARALADFFEVEGWRAVALGGGLPAAEVATGLAAFEADLLALSISLSTQARAAIETVRRARAAKPGVKILLGGRIVSSTPEIWRKLGADGSALGYEDALRVAAELVGLR